MEEIIPLSEETSRLRFLRKLTMSLFQIIKKKKQRKIMPVSFKSNELRQAYIQFYVKRERERIEDL